MIDRLYLEPDHFADVPDHFAEGHDGSLPIISAIGRGPKGDSIHTEYNEAGALVIKDDDGNILATVATPDVAISQPHEIVAGQEAEVDFIITHGNGSKTTVPIFMPPGRDGTRWYFSWTDLEAFGSEEPHTASIPIALLFYGSYSGENVVPRVGDMVCSRFYFDGGDPFTNFATITNIDQDTHMATLNLFVRP